MVSWRLQAIMSLHKIHFNSVGNRKIILSAPQKVDYFFKDLMRR